MAEEPKAYNMEKIANFIDGKFTGPVSGAYINNYDPAEGIVYSHVPDSDVEDVQRAVNAAQKAFRQWSAMPVQERSRILQRIADLIDEQMETLAHAESRDTGKPLSLAKRMDIPRASANMRFFATAILHQSTEAHATDDVAINYTTQNPVGVVGCISPWNLPLYLFTWKIAPALAAGCTVVAKPSELAPMTAYLFCELCEEAGLPNGVLNVVHGLGHKVGQVIVEHPQVKAISFTGGTATGKKIAASAAPMFKKLSLELGGKNPNIIFTDADLDEAVSASITSSFANQGEICLCGSRIFVERAVYDDFVSKFVEHTKVFTVGDPLHGTSRMGALISASHRDKVEAYIALAKEEGGTILTGGTRVHVDGRCSKGYFIAPTVITGLSPSCRTNQEEIFGPVVTITPFDKEEEVIEFANGTAYGLAATIWTNNLKRAHRVASQLHAGIVWVNCWLLRDLRTPFGGVKQSGIGREGGWDALQFFTEKKNICIKL